MARVARASAKVFYEESKAAREELDSVLHSYRRNSTTILALATASATLFGFSDNGGGAWYWLALLSYGVAVGLTLSIFLPIGWYFNVVNGADAVLASPPDHEPVSATKMYFDLGLGHQQAVQHNAQKIDGKYQIRDRFAGLVLCTGLVVCFGGVSSMANPGVADPIQVQIVEESK